MSILLLVLKWLGLLILIIIGIILLLITIILFFPGFYKGSYQHDEGSSDTKLFFHFKWIFSLIEVYYKLENGEKVFYYKVLGKMNPPIRLSAIKKKLKKHLNIGSKKPPATRASAIRKTMDKKTQTWKEWVDDIFEDLRDVMHPKTLSILFKELSYLLKHWAPKKINARFNFSAGDPANTGMSFGFISLFPGLYKKGIQWNADFESDKPYFNGQASFRGRVQFYYFFKFLFVLAYEEDTQDLLSLIEEIDNV